MEGLKSQAKKIIFYWKSIEEPLNIWERESDRFRVKSSLVTVLRIPSNWSKDSRGVCKLQVVLRIWNLWDLTTRASKGQRIKRTEAWMPLFQGPERMQDGMGADREALKWRVINTELMDSFCLFGFCDH